ncbi:MAG: ATP-binding cassette domain-containing protein [Deltaproteobacteria bacterium]|nr:ATP-binding cassette domain-containing protein [Deltaproteobacteria bacterium]
MIELKHLSLSNILTNINITFPEGGYIGIAGPNGSGKSSLARIIKGIQDPSRGEVYINGEIRPKGKVSSGIGLLLSSPENQLVSSSIEEDVAFGLENMNLPSLEIAKRTEEALKLGDLWELRDIPAHHLSAGQQQMLVIAGIMAMQPGYLIIDEGTSMIDPQGRVTVLDAVKKINREKGVGVIHISHDLSEIIVARTIFILDRGNVVWGGEPSKLHHQEPLLRGLGMELPPLLKLKSLMISSGYDISDKAMTAEEMADEVIKVISRSV